MHAPTSYQAHVLTPVGVLGIQCANECLNEVIFLNINKALNHPNDALTREVSRQLAAYFNSADFQFDLPLNYSATPHQHKVWQALIDIPCGQIKTYGDLAALLHSSARAVGQACGANPIPIVIPCHRVVSKAGLGGFMHQAQGKFLDIKRQLLAHEHH